jgi:hypothetical protein
LIFGDGPIGSGAIGNNNLLIIEVSNDGQLYLSGATDVEANLSHFQVYDEGTSTIALVISANSIFEKSLINIFGSTGDLYVSIPTETSATLNEFSTPTVDFAADSTITTSYNIVSPNTSIYIDLTSPFANALAFDGIGTDILISTVSLIDAILFVDPVTITCALTDYPDGVDVLIDSPSGMDSNGIAWVRVDGEHVIVWSYDPAFHILTDTPERAAAAAAIGFNDQDVLIEVPMPPPDPAYVGSTSLVQALLQHKTLVITIKESATSSTVLVINTLSGDSKGYHWEVINGYLLITLSVTIAISGSSSNNLLVFSRSNGNLAVAIPTVTSTTLYENSAVDATLESQTDTYTILLEYSDPSAELTAFSDISYLYAQGTYIREIIEGSSTTQITADVPSTGTFLFFVGSTQIEIENTFTSSGLTLRGKSRPAITVDSRSSSSIEISSSTNEYAIYNVSSAVGGVTLAGQTRVEVPFIITNIQLNVSGTTEVDFVRSSKGAFTINGKTDTATVNNETSSIANVITADTSNNIVINTASTSAVELNGSTDVNINWIPSNGALELSADTQVEVFVAALPNGATETATRQDPARQVAYISHVRYGIAMESEMSFHRAPDKRETEDDLIIPPKRPLGDLGRFLQNFGKKVDYSYNSTNATATARFNIDSDVEVGNFLQRRVLDELFDSDDALLLGMTNISEDALIMYSESTGELWNMAKVQDKFNRLREQDDLDLLGISDQEINILS